jgi:hypothetical protein
MARTRERALVAAACVACLVAQGVAFHDVFLDDA